MAKLKLKPVIRLAVVSAKSDSNSQFGPGVANLCMGVREMGSLNAAAKSMHMAYSKAWRIMKETEAALGTQLLNRDGAHGSTLTKDGNGWVLYYCTMTGGAFKWRGGEDPADPVLCVRRNQLLWLLDGLTVEQPKAVQPTTARTVL